MAALRQIRESDLWASRLRVKPNQERIQRMTATGIVVTGRPGDIRGRPVEATVVFIDYLVVHELLHLEPGSFLGVECHISGGVSTSTRLLT